MAEFSVQFSATESSFHHLKGHARESTFIEQPTEMPSLKNDRGLVKVSCHGLDFKQRQEEVQRSSLLSGHLNKNKLKGLKNPTHHSFKS